MTKCSRCREAKPAPNHRWCRGCKRDYEKLLRRTKIVRAEHRGAVRAVRIFREESVKVFRNIGLGELNGYTAAEIMRTLEVPDEDAR